MSEPVKCGWCGLVDPSPHSEVIHRGTLECVDTQACANRLAESEKDELRAAVERLTRERDEARALLQAATDNAFDAGAKAQGLEDSHRFVAMRKERDEARADYERARADFLRCAETQRAAFADAATDADLLRAEVKRLSEVTDAIEAELEAARTYLAAEGCGFDPPCDLCEVKSRVLRRMDEARKRARLTRHIDAETYPLDQHREVVRQVAERQREACAMEFGNHDEHVGSGRYSGFEAAQRVRATPLVKEDEP